MNMEMMKKMRMVDFALMYARRGWSVIPLRSRNKRPLLQEWREFQSRRATEEEITAWWARCKTANIGIVTGSVSGIVVLDLDNQEAVDFAKAQGIPPTPVASTGKGFHVYFQHPSFPVPNAVALNGVQGLDVRGDGGYVVAPPSLHPSGRRYVWTSNYPAELQLAPCPGWLIEMLKNRNYSQTQEMQEMPKRDPSWVVELLKGVEEGQRNDAATRLAGHWLARGLSEAEVWQLLLDWNKRNKPPLPERELEAVFQSIFSREVQKPRKNYIRLTGRVAVPAGWNKEQAVVTDDWDIAREAYQSGHAVVVVFKEGTLPAEAASVIKEANNIDVIADEKAKKQIEWSIYPLLVAKEQVNEETKEETSVEQKQEEKENVSELKESMVNKTVSNSSSSSLNSSKSDKPVKPAQAEVPITLSTKLNVAEIHLHIPELTPWPETEEGLETYQYSATWHEWLTTLIVNKGKWLEIPTIWDAAILPEDRNKPKWRKFVAFNVALLNRSGVELMVNVDDDRKIYARCIRDYTKINNGDVLSVQLAKASWLRTYVAWFLKVMKELKCEKCRSAFNIVDGFYSSPAGQEEEVIVEARCSENNHLSHIIVTAY